MSDLVSDVTLTATNLTVKILTTTSVLKKMTPNDKHCKYDNGKNPFLRDAGEGKWRRNGLNATTRSSWQRKLQLEENNVKVSFSSEAVSLSLPQSKHCLDYYERGLRSKLFRSPSAASHHPRTRSRLIGIMIVRIMNGCGPLISQTTFPR